MSLNSTILPEAREVPNPAQCRVMKASKLYKSKPQNKITTNNKGENSRKTKMSNNSKRVKHSKANIRSKMKLQINS